MVKYIVISVCLLGFKLAFTQSKIITPNFFVVRQGLSIDANKSQDIGIHIAAEYFNTEKLSLVGEGNIFLESAKPDNKELAFSHSVFSGINYHKINNNIDLYFGLQPGLTISKRIPNSQFTAPNNVVSPLISVSTGFSYYSTNYFHFYTQVRYIHGNHLEENSVSLSGLRFTFGLGYNLSQIFSKK